MNSLLWDPNGQYALVTLAAVINFWPRLSVSGNVWLAACFILTVVVLIHGLLLKMIFHFQRLVCLSYIMFSGGNVTGTCSVLKKEKCLTQTSVSVISGVFSVTICKAVRS